MLKIRNRIFVTSQYIIFSMKKSTLLFILIFISYHVQAQVPEFDKLEMLFSQRHYKNVYRKSGRLLDNSEYNYSMMPSYYRSLSIIQLAKNNFWREHHSNELESVKEFFYYIKKSEHSEGLFNAHMYELNQLKDNMENWASDLMDNGDISGSEEVHDLTLMIFGDLPGSTVDGLADIDLIESTNISNIRALLVLSAKKYIGIPYVWAGNSPSGFDCSGFTKFIMNENKIDLPRRAEDQYNESRKLNRKDVSMGDLIFFSNGSGVSHVGIIVSELGQPLSMIHSSSSKGVILTEMDKSEYWLKLLHGFGTFVK